TWSGSAAIPSDTSITGMRVAFDNRVVSALACFGSRCWINTNAIPDADGNAFSRAVNAAKPPAEAPIATTGNESPGRALEVSVRISAMRVVARALRGFGAVLAFAIRRLKRRLTERYHLAADRAAVVY